MATQTSQLSPQTAEWRERRRQVMALLACSEANEIAHHLQSLDPLPRHDLVRAPESGMLMVRGRISGDGAPFHFGEATVSRAVVRLNSGEIGYGYTLGRDHDKVRLIALCDALVQHEGYCAALERRVLAPIRDRLAAARRTDAERVAATKVEFFTLVRGEG